MYYICNMEKITNTEEMTQAPDIVAPTVEPQVRKMLMMSEQTLKTLRAMLGKIEFDKAFPIIDFLLKNLQEVNVTEQNSQ